MNQFGSQFAPVTIEGFTVECPAILGRISYHFNRDAADTWECDCFDVVGVECVAPGMVAAPSANDADAAEALLEDERKRAQIRALAEQRRHS